MRLPRPAPSDVGPGRIAYTRTRVLEVTPQVLERHRLASVRNDTTADPFRLLRTQVLMQMRQNGWQTLAMTSPNKGAGKSTVALNLAMSFAMEADYTALLVDADLRDPDVRHMLELEPGPGLVDYLLGDAALEDLLIHPNVGNLVVLPGGAPVANTSELMRSPMMADMIREMRGRYRDRLIVFDVPPVLAGADTLALSAYMDATILLVEECKTRARRHPALVRAAERLEPAGHCAQQVARVAGARAHYATEAGILAALFRSRRSSSMYESFYGFNVRPFALLPQEEFMFLSRQHRMALDLLVYGLSNRALFCVVTGDIGTGKTTLLRYLLKRRGPQISVGMVTGMSGTFIELLQWILAEFGLEYQGLDKIGMQQLLVEFVKREEARGRRMVLIVDEAQALALDVLEELRLFSNVSAGYAPMLQIVLVGQLSLRDTLRRRRDAPVRTAGRSRLPPHAARQGADPGLHPSPAGPCRTGAGGSVHPRCLRCHLRIEPRYSAHHQSAQRHCAGLRLRRPETGDRREHRQRDAAGQGARGRLAVQSA